MIQFALILYCIVGFWLGQVLAMQLRFVPVVAVHLGVLALLCLAATLTARIYFQTEEDKQSALGKFERMLGLGAARWIIPVGLGAIAMTGLGIFGSRHAPAEDWLLAAIAVCLLVSLLRKTICVILPTGLPVMRCATSPCLQTNGDAVSFTWVMWSDVSESFRWEQEFKLAPDVIPPARSDIHLGQPFSHWVQAHFSDSVRQVVIWFREKSLRHGFLPMQEAENVVSFVRSIRYESDSVLHGQEDYYSYPIETLADQAGDCEDHAFLAATILYFLGHDVALFALDLASSGHLALAYHVSETSAAMSVTGPFAVTDSQGVEYHYIETVPTSASEQLGNLNGQFLNELKSAKVFPAV
jgi:predicted transglutaminase-like cysteine proteinase